MIAGLGYTLIERFERLQKANIIGIVTVIILSVIVVLFSLINFSLLRNNYPNKNLTPTKKNFYTAILGFYCLTTLLVSGVYFYGTFDTIKSLTNGSGSKSGIEVLIGMTLFLFFLIYILIQSIKLEKLIYKNAQLKALEINADEKDILSSIIIDNQII